MTNSVHKLFIHEGIDLMLTGLGLAVLGLGLEVYQLYESTVPLKTRLEAK